MSSLFNKLLLTASTGEKTPTEDFFTEIFAYILNENQSILFDWVRAFGLSEIIPDSHIVRTQVTFPALEGHPCESRPDIYVELSNENERDIFFIENKISSSEGDNQLKRYAEHLDNFRAINHAKLVYITRDYEGKSEKEIKRDCKYKNRMDFVHIRWHEVYEFLNKYNDNILVKEVTKFMEEYNMDLSNQFNSVDILALTNFPRVRKMMEETMRGEAYELFKDVAKSICRHSACLTQLRNRDRYIYYSEQENDLWCGYGYWFDTSRINNYPIVRINLEISLLSKHYQEVSEAMNTIEKSGEWQKYDYPDTRKWDGICQEKSLREFMPQDDHIDSIKKFFADGISKLEEIRQNYPELPWRQ